MTKYEIKNTVLDGINIEADTWNNYTSVTLVIMNSIIKINN